MTTNPNPEVDFSKPVWLKTWGGIPVKAVYTAKDIEGSDVDKSVGLPGEYPFTRGIHPEMYRSRLWLRRQLTGYGSAEDTYERQRFLERAGQTGLHPVVDIPTQCEIDSDHPLAEEEVGLAGVPMCSLQDMEELMRDIPLDEINPSLAGSLNMTFGVFYIAMAEKRGYDISKLRGTHEFCGLLGTYAEGKERKPAEIRIRVVVDAGAFCAERMPFWSPFSLNSYSWPEGGFGAAEEMGITLAEAKEYLRAALKKGIDIDKFAQRMTFTSSAHVDFFETCAKLRATRRIWARMLKEEFGAKDLRSCRFRVQTNTSGCALVRPQPLNNIIRLCYQALGAILGGTQSLQVMSYDESLGLPTEIGQMLSQRTQQILAYETGVANVVDPLAGSYYVEWLTNTLEKEINRVIREIEELGGLGAVMESGWLHQKEDEATYRHQRELEQKERIVVGVNAFTIPEDKDKDLGLHVTSRVSTRGQIAKVKKLKKERDIDKVKAAVARLYEKARNREENIYPAMIEAAQAYATTGEIAGTIRTAYGYSYDPYGVIENPF